VPGSLPQRDKRQVYRPDEQGIYQGTVLAKYRVSVIFIRYLGAANWLPFFLEFYLNMNLVQIVFEVTSDEQVTLLPHLYDAVRRFDNFFKSVTCYQKSPQCNLCKENDQPCPYRAVFGQVLSNDPDVLRRHQKPPLPFSFKFRYIDHSNSSLELELVIMGNAIRHLSAFVSAVYLMTKSVGKNIEVDVDVTGTWCRDYQGERHELNSVSQSPVLLSAMEILESTLHSDPIRICLESPLRLLRGGSVAHFFDFAIMLRSQLRRCSSLFAYYGEGELEMDYVFMSEGASKVNSFGNDFKFMKPEWSQRADLAGLLGEGEFRDLAYGMQPLLKLGSYFNAGKGAAFGMGVYRVEVV